MKWSRGLEIKLEELANSLSSRPSQGQPKRNKPMTESTPEETGQMIKDCQKRESRMTEWECNFIESIDEQFSRNGSLSPKQLQILDNIWEKVTANG